MLMNFSANLLGLDNAATPFGLKAMESLQTLNPNKDTASNSQIMFLCLHAGGMTLIPSRLLPSEPLWDQRPYRYFPSLHDRHFCGNFSCDDYCFFIPENQSSSSGGNSLCRRNFSNYCFIGSIPCTIE